MRKEVKEAMKHLRKVRELVRKNPSPIFKMSKQEVIKQLRRTREQIWEGKLAARH